MRNYCFILL